MRAAIAGMAVLLGVLPITPCGAELPLSGYVQGGWSVRATGAECPPGMNCEFIRAEQRLQLRLEPASASGRAGALVRVDVVRDALTNDAYVDPRELFAEVTGRRASARVGRQVVTWGLGDLLFINDVFPKDWNAFLSGAPLEYLKIGSDAIRLGYYPERVTIETVITPVFEPDVAPDPQQLFYYDPFPPEATRTTTHPPRELGNAQLALRLYRPVGSHEIALYASRGFWGLPSARPDSPLPSSITLFYPRLDTWGASLQGPLFGGVYSLEAGYYDSRDDEDGDDPMIENSQARALAAYQFQPWSEGTLSFQGYLENMQDHDRYRASLPDAFRPRDRNRTVLGLRLRQFLAHQTVMLGFFVLASPSDEDGYVNPSVRYQVTDELWTELGGNVFEGEHPDTFYGQFEKNSHVYVTVRYAF